MNYIIKELSSTGFKTSTGWFTCDKFKVLDKPIFKGLKIGDEVSNIKTNQGGFVIAFDIFVAKKPESEVVSSAPQLDSPIQASKMDKQILKGQALNIAFRDSTLEILSFKDQLDKRIELAQKIYVKLEEANYYGW